MRNRRLAGRATGVAAAVAMAGALSLSMWAGSPAGATTTTQPKAAGYRMVASDGGVFTFGSLPYYGSMGGKALNAPIVGIASPDADGYWLVASDGGIFSYGDAPFLGSMGGKTLNKPIVGMADDYALDGGSNGSGAGYGYWEVASDGGVFAFGNAPYFGSLAGKAISAPIVGIASTGDGGGYWLVGNDGAVYAFGDAAMPANGYAGPALSKQAANGARTVAGIASPGTDDSTFDVITTTDALYSSASANWTIPYQGPTSTAGIVGLSTSVTPSNGLYIAGADGGIFNLNGSTFYGSMGGTRLNKPIVGIDGY